MNMKKLMEINEVTNFKSVGLVFENCDMVIFNKEEIQELDIGKDSGEFFGEHFLDYMYIRVSNSALNKTTEFMLTAKERLVKRDITWVYITYENGDMIDYQLVYSENDSHDSENSYQKNKFNESYLEIKITDELDMAGEV